jgi:hypothetical protein
MSAQLHAMTHGVQGLELAYAILLVAIIAGLFHAPRDSWGKLLLSPLLALPMLLISGIVIAVMIPLERLVGISGEIPQTLFGLVATFAMGYAAGRALAAHKNKTDDPEHRRGATVMSAQPTSGWSLSRASKRHAPSGRITLAGIPIPLEDETKHFKFIGTTGTGKSTAIREMLSGALGRGDRAIIADPDGGYLNRFYDPSRGDVILNPFDGDAHKWNLFGEITTDYDINQLARSLIPNGTDSDRIWCEFARTFFAALAKQAIRAGNRDDSELFRLVTSAERDELRLMLAGTPAGQFLAEGNEKMFGSMRSVAIAAVQALEYTTQQQAEPFSVRQWVREGAARHAGGQGGVLFIPYSAGQIAALRTIISAWMRLAIFEAMDRPEGDQRLWFSIDEVDALGEIDGLKDALARLRKFGGRCKLGLQSIGQLSGTYGRSAAGTIVENCANTYIFRCSASEHGGTSEFASKLIGQREVIHTTKSRTGRFIRWLSPTTTSQQLRIEPAVMASEIERLPDLAGFLKLASVPDWQFVKLTPRNEPIVPRPSRQSAVVVPSAPASPPQVSPSIPPRAPSGLSPSAPPTPLSPKVQAGPAVPPTTPDLATLQPAINRPRKSREARKAAPKRPRQPKAASKRAPIPSSNAADASPLSPQRAVPNPGDGGIPSPTGGADS